MSSDRSAFALEAFDAVADEDRPPAAAPVCDLAELASALARVEALVSAGADERGDAVAAIERIADIAFVLHEREVEPSLCDALDAAMREISAANARNQASVQRAHEAAELLRAVARRLDAMMAAQAQPQASRSAAHSDELECADEFPAPTRLFDADVAADGAFAQTVAALAESLPERSGAALAQSRDHGTDGGAAPDALPHSDVEPELAETLPSAWMQEENPVSGAGEEAAPRKGFAATSAAVAAPDPAAAASLALPSGAAAAPAVDVHRSIDPDEDPGDLFEPTPDIRPAADAAAPPPAMSADTTQDIAPPASLAPQSPRSAAGAPAYAASRHAVSDPLAPIRALSEEELIALFS